MNGVPVYSREPFTALTHRNHVPPLLALLDQAQAVLSPSAVAIPYAIIAGGIASLTVPRLVSMVRGARDVERMRDERDQLFAISADLLCILDRDGGLQ